MATIRSKVKATNIKVTSTIDAYLNEKLEQIARILPKGEENVSCAVELAKTTKHHKAGKVFRAEMNLKIGGKMFRAEALEESIEAAIDEAKDELKAEVRKMSDRSKSSIKKGGRTIKRMMRGE